VSLKKLGVLAAIVAAFAAGTRAGVEYAKGHYVVRDRKFIEGDVVKSNDRKK
jgi:hypothetical protein